MFTEHQKTTAASSRIRAVVYRDDSAKIRWRILANGSSAIIADSGQGYRHKSDAFRGLELSVGGLHERGMRIHNDNGVYEQGWIYRLRSDGRLESIFVEYKLPKWETI